MFRQAGAPLPCFSCLAAQQPGLAHVVEESLVRRRAWPVAGEGWS